MRLLFVSTIHAAWGASERLWAATADRAAAEGHEVFASAWPSAELSALRGVRVYPRRDVWDRGLGLKLLRRSGLERTLAWRALDRQSPQVVLLSHGSGYDRLADPGVMEMTTSWCRARRVPYLTLVHGVDESRTVNEYGRRVMCDYLGAAARVLFVSKGNWRAMEAQIGCPINGTVVRNPIADPGAVPWPASVVPRLGLVGRLDQQAKGFDRLVEALSGLRQVPWEVSIYGQGPDEQVIRDLVATAGLTERVRFAGHQSVAAIWEREQILVSASRVEGASLALAEAMMAARPVVATSVGGAAEWLDADSGWLAGSDLTGALAAALDRHSEWPKMGRAARARALQLVDPDPAGSLLRILEGLG
jgi:glycosyltransferase involved in cell wall biosynthesis